jgi:hypothetical protein
VKRSLDHPMESKAASDCQEVLSLGEREKLNLWGMRHWFEADAARLVEEFTIATSELLNSGDLDHLYRALANVRQIKSIFQRIHNYYHALALLAAKAFLQTEFPTLPWSEIEFADDPNRSGHDIVVDSQGARIVGEVKTTEPCGDGKSTSSRVKFNSKQKKEITKDLNALSSRPYLAYARYMFVTSPLAYQILVADFREQFPRITFVLLSRSAEVSRAKGVHRKRMLASAARAKIPKATKVRRAKFRAEKDRKGK